MKLITCSAALLILSTAAFALPSLTDHENSAQTIMWERDGTFDGSSAHNHFSTDDFGGDRDPVEPFSFDHCWDNRTDRLDEAGDFDNGHCFIDESNANNSVRYRFMGTNWNTQAQARIRDAFDVFNDVTSNTADLVTGIEFIEVTAGASEIEIFWENQNGQNGGGFWSDADRELHIDNSMNWFFGVDPMEGQAGGIQNGQWHFFTVMLHEVGHAVGFEHQSDGDLMDPPVGQPPDVAGHRYFTGLDGDTLDGVRSAYSQPDPAPPEPIIPPTPQNFDVDVIDIQSPYYTYFGNSFSWDPVVDNSTQTYYEIYEGELVWYQLRPTIYHSQTTGTVKSISVQNETYFAVRACNELGCSDFTGFKKAHIPSSTPDVPDKPWSIPTYPGSSSYSVNWNSLTYTDYYQVYTRPVNCFSCSYTLYSQTTGTWQYVSNRKNHLLSVRACNHNGCSWYSPPELLD